MKTTQVGDTNVVGRPGQPLLSQLLQYQDGLALKIRVAAFHHLCGAIEIVLQNKSVITMVG
ncbi:hypothetical protein GCM10010971_04340 [Silvimonas amylolytica]|uniref:Uncharacterized protein n=1 Tax=Silvimonas amylolytica TaxID=449663 RepID=A0ABQ2PHA3_9NEIS|nr:hypothetical protein GCM10010971_04340 [Silvimonas amylolytica]